MLRFETLAKAADKLSNPKFLEDMLLEAAAQHTKELKKLIRGQISVGVKGDGSNTMKYVDDGTRFNPNYYVAKIKLTPSKRMPFRNYEHTGEFLDDMFAVETNTSILIGSDNEKTPIIEGEEGNELFELTDENKPVFLNIILPTFLKMMKDEFTR